MINVSFVKVHENAKMPVRNNSTDSGYDMFSPIEFIIPAKSSVNIKSGLKLGFITESYWIRVESRSGLGWKNDIVGFNGIIDNEYRGEIGIKLFNHSNTDFKINVGDRIAQLVIYKRYDAELVFIDDIIDSNRGENGFGSSGK